MKIKAMMDFEKLNVYQCIKKLNIDLLKYLYSCSDVDPYLKDQIKRSTLSVALNLAEGTGRESNADKRHYFVMARSSCFESVATLQMILELSSFSKENYQDYYSRYTEVIKMLFGLIKSTRK